MPPVCRADASMRGRSAVGSVSRRVDPFASGVVKRDHLLAVSRSSGASRSETETCRLIPLPSGGVRGATSHVRPRPICSSIRRAVPRVR
mgnify:CR=1 FL=1